MPLHAEKTTLVVETKSEKSISPDLVGILFGDLNYAADGGLHAELAQNRSFEYSPTEQPFWDLLTGWEFVRRGGNTHVFPTLNYEAPAYSLTICRLPPKK